MCKRLLQSTMRGAQRRGEQEWVSTHDPFGYMKALNTRDYIHEHENLTGIIQMRNKQQPIQSVAMSRFLIFYEI